MKKYNKILAMLLALTMVLSLAACGGSQAPAETPAETPEAEAPAAEAPEASDPASDKLVVYSPWSDVELEIAIPAFEEQYGIDVEVISGGAGELVARVEAEKDDPQGDVILGGSVGVFMPALDLWEEYVSPEDANILDEYKNTTGKISTYCIVPTVILANTNLIGDIEINGWNDLLKPELKGKIAFADPAASSLSNVLLFNMLTVMGDGKDLNTGWDFMNKLADQLDGKVLSGSSKVPKGVADGEYTVGLTHELYYATYLADNAPVKAIYPEEGSAAIAGPAVIIKNAPNMENAKLFIDYILGKDFQERYRDGHDARSVRVDVSAPGTMPAIDSFKIIPEVVADADVQNEVLEKFKDAVYE